MSQGPNTIWYKTTPRTTNFDQSYEWFWDAVEAQYPEE